MNISKSMHNLCTNYSEIHVVTSLGVAAKKTFPISAQATKRVMIHYSVALSSYPPVLDVSLGLFNAEHT
jgi:hypothetical protein